MTRLVYIFWLLGAVLLFAAALLLVLANPDTVMFNILLPGGQLELRLGVLVLVTLATGLVIGLLGGLGLRYLLALVKRGG
jgi:uncharacterized membrane protein YciS (DUF1049 family)